MRTRHLAPHRRRRGIVTALASFLLVATQVFVMLPAVSAATNDLRLSVTSARDESRALGGAGVSQGDPVTAYKWMINLDNTGTTEQRTPGDGCSPEDPDYPGSCHWASIAGLRSSSPVIAQGDETALSDTVALQNLPDGRYLISVLADGFKLDGVGFTVPLSGSGIVDLALQPLPLPTATIQAQVFADTDSTNGQYDPEENGIAGFAGKIADSLGQVTTDVYGNPLCTTYVTDGSGQVILDGDLLPTVQTIGSKCLSDASGVLTIPNLGPNRYALTLVPPTGSSWVQTTTLEGNHDWDAWVMEGATGLDTEFVVAGEPFPAIIFGYVPGPTTNYWNDAAHKFVAGGTGTIKGVVDAVDVYVPTTGGVNLPGDCCGGMTGAKVDHQIDKPWVVLSDLGRGDTAVWVGRGDSHGAFTIPNVPDGTYQLTYWDEPQDYILELLNVTVNGGETVDMGILPIAGWFTTYEGYIFNDTNRNGRKDPGEAGVPNFGLTLRTRSNSLIDRGSTSATTDQSGHYFFESAYPLNEWLVLEAYDDRYYTTGVTYQADNQNDPTTILGQGVDVSVLPVIGLGGTIDWGVHAYDPSGTNGIDPQNGGIVGSVSYDTTRNELDPRYAAAEDWQPGVSGLTVDLYASVPCPADGTVACDADGIHALADDGSYARGKLLNTYVSETWQTPTDCAARDVNGDELTYPDKQQVLPPSSGGYACLEGPLMGVQFGTYPDAQGTPDANFGAAVDGNYGFGDGCFNGDLDAADPSAPECVGGTFESLPADDYLVHVENADDMSGNPIYQFTREEDINIGNGDSFVPQVPPPACVSSLHQVDVADLGTDGYLATTIPDPSDSGGPDLHVGASETVANPTFVDIGGSPYEGQATPLCDTKLVTLQNGKSVVPMFNVFTDIPLPGRFFGLLVDDLNFSSDPKSLLYGEKAGIPFAPVGIYDYANRLVTTVETDFNGIYDVLLPSTNRINCPTPSGVCSNLYRLVGNDPGIPGRLNLNYNPQFRTIAAEFEIMPGLIIPADNAPTQMGVSIQLPGSQQNQAVSCTLNLPGVTPTTPELWTVSKPYADLGIAAQTFTITGQGFGATKGAGSVTLDGVDMPTTTWTDRQIVVSVPATTVAGPHQLAVKAGNGRTTVNGLTFHVFSAPPTSLPALTLLDDFNRANANNTLGSNWSDLGVDINTNRARGLGQALWNVPSAGFGANQGAAFTFGPAPLTDGALILKATGGASATPQNFIRVRYTGTQVRVESTTNFGVTYTNAGSQNATFATGDTMSAIARADGSVSVFKTTGATTTFLTTKIVAGSVGTGVGRIGISLPNNVSVDNFRGGAVPAAGPTYRPALFEVGVGKPNATIQAGIDAAAGQASDALVVVYPGTPQGARLNPRGAYYENLIIATPLKLQGVGPGGVYPDGTPVTGSIVDGSAFGGDTALADAWRTKMATLTWVGQQGVFEGPVMTVLAQTTGQFGQTYKAAIDGFDIRGGDQSNFPNNINEIGGGPTGLPPNAETQGGGLFLNAYAHYFQITNNVLQSNSGSYAGAIRVGTPDLPAPDTSQHNDHVRIANNRIIANAGTNLAGGIGLFAGSDSYDVAANDICANFSAEYGGGISVYGLSPSGSIHDNRIYFNRSFDEGGGIMIAGELPADPSILSPGSGAVDILRNTIQANLANDDGGGLRFLMAGNFPMNVVDNVIANNISTHEGGGIAIDDAPNVRIVNDTIAKNMTTATAVTSNGQPAPAGVSTGANSALLQATLPGSPTFSSPTMFNDIFWDNRAGTQASGTVTGVGLAGDASPIVHWDVGTADASGLPAPTNSMLQVSDGTVVSATNTYGVNPTFISEYDTSVAFQPWRGNVNLVGAIMVATDVPPTLMGDYHIPTSSPARDALNSVTSVGSVSAPAVDIDNAARPTGARYDLGADELPGTTVLAFPRTAVLDAFPAASGGLGANWDGDTNTNNYRIQTSQVQVRGGGTVWWRAGSTPGANQEAFVTLTKLSATATQQGLLLKSKSPGVSKASYIKVVLATGGTVQVWTKAPKHSPFLQTTFAATFAVNDKLGVRTQSDGSVSVFKNGVLVGTTNVTGGTHPWAASLAGSGGRIGVVYAGTGSPPNDATFDDFGGGTLP
jgi:SdrD B-like domain/IPT/TIG domain